MSPDTLLAAPPLFAGPVFALFFFWVATALGFRLMRWLRVPTLTFSPWEHGFVAAALGPAHCSCYRVLWRYSAG